MALARSRVLRHPAGISIKTPLLVPSFSSKGFNLKEPKKGSEINGFFKTEMVLEPDKNRGTGWVSDVTEILLNTSEVLTEAILVSAYDIFHRHIPLPYLNVLPEIIFVDSGGYEKEDIFDYSEIMRSNGITNEWKIEHYKEVLNVWPVHVPAVFVSFDYQCRGKSVLEQIELAKELFSKYRKKHLCAILLKPTSKEAMTFKNTTTEICGNVNELSYFDIVAFTETDIGNSVLQNMENIARIRLAMDDAGIDSPIHIFGSLDPLTSCLYFLSGAEIFDGLTWLRYGYLEGKAIYYRNNGILTLGIHEKNDFVKARNINDNIYYLRELQYEMMEYLLDCDFNKFQYNSEILEKAFNRLRTKFERRNI